RLRAAAPLVRHDRAEAAPGDLARDARQAHALAKELGQLARQPVVAAHDLVIPIEVGVPGGLVLHGGPQAYFGGLGRPRKGVLGDTLLLLGAELQVVEALLKRCRMTSV